MNRDRERDRGEVMPAPSLLPRMAYVEAALRHWQLQDLIPAVRLYVAPLPPRLAPIYWDERRQWVQLGSESFCDSNKYMYNVEYACGMCFHPNQKYYVRARCEHMTTRRSWSFHDAGVRLSSCLTCVKDMEERYVQMKEWFPTQWKCGSCGHLNSY